ncbi:MAG: hypothetical protein J6386_20880 [Candidatus Synoicihabitans palmerolidicus]|nr:hypothetical protein [Candidatus Synoicihabitans palmerolidicus]
MDALSEDRVFDEWAMVTLGTGGARLAAYQGPRVEQFRVRFNADIRPLRVELEGRRLEVGEFAFVANAPGTTYDACVRVGAQAYLGWNNTYDGDDGGHPRSRVLVAGAACLCRPVRRVPARSGGGGRCGLAREGRKGESPTTAWRHVMRPASRNPA